MRYNYNPRIQCGPLPVHETLELTFVLTSPTESGEQCRATRDKYWPTYNGTIAPEYSSVLWTGHLADSCASSRLGYVRLRNVVVPLHKDDRALQILRVNPR